MPALLFVLPYLLRVFVARVHVYGFGQQRGCLFAAPAVSACVVPKVAVHFVASVCAKQSDSGQHATGWRARASLLVYAAHSHARPPY